MTKIILATGSVPRREAFELLDIPFIAEESNIDENFEGRPDNPEELVQQLAKLKAEAVAKNHKEGIVIGFDSVGYFEGEILEKPKNREEAFGRLKRLSGKKYDFITGIYIKNISTEKTLTKVVKTETFIREIDEDEINKYLDQDDKYVNYAHGYDPLGFYSASFVEKINGSPNNFLRGIPLEAIVEMLKEVRYKIK